MALTCPNCKTDLWVQEIKGITTHYCTTCKGVALHKGELNKIIEDHEGDLEFSSLDLEDHKDKEGAISCPHCDYYPLERVNFLAHSDIILDHCRRCDSLWLDGGELENIESYWNEISEKKDIHDPAIIQFLNLVKAFFPR